MTDRPPTAADSFLPDAPKRTEADALRERVERRHGVKIRTSFDYPPIPVRSSDWSAVTDDYEAWPDGEDGWTTSHPCGRGATEAEAIADLAEQLDERKESP